MKIFIITCNYSTRSRGTGNVTRRGPDSVRNRGTGNMRRRWLDSVGGGERKET